MSTLAEPWCQPTPTRSGLAELRPPGLKLWDSRLSLDRKRAADNQTASLLEITRAIETRSRELEVAALS